MEVKLGSLTLPNPVFYSPLAGCSDFPFRKMAAKYRPGLMYCEMVKIHPVVMRHPNTMQMLEYSEDMRPIGAQICGSDPKLSGEAAKIIEDLGFDVIDLNCGCPVDKVTKDGSGSGMLKMPERIGEVLTEMIHAVKIPVTVKIRAGWDESCINATQVTKIAEQAGAKAIAIHGRTRAQAYRGRGNRGYIKECKEIAKNILVIGNGDIFNAQDALDMFEETGCDVVLASRGTMGQPWIAQDILAAMEGRPVMEASVDQIREHLYEHFRMIVEYRNERQALLDMRRVGCWYLKKICGVKEVRMQINKAQSIDEVFGYLDHFFSKDLVLSGEAAVVLS